jgi:hypothetical protein
MDSRGDGQSIPVVQAVPVAGFQLPLASLMKKVFPHGSPQTAVALEINGNNALHLQGLPARLSQNPLNRCIVISHMPDQLYTQYLDNLIGGWTINNLLLSHVENQVIEKIFWCLLEENNELKVLGLDNLSNDAVAVIYEYVCLLSPKLPVSVFIGENINSAWQRQFDSLHNRDHWSLCNYLSAKKQMQDKFKEHQAIALKFKGIQQRLQSAASELKTTNDSHQRLRSHFTDKANELIVAEQKIQVFKTRSAAQLVEIAQSHSKLNETLTTNEQLRAELERMKKQNLELADKLFDSQMAQTNALKELEIAKKVAAAAQDKIANTETQLVAAREEVDHLGSENQQLSQSLAKLRELESVVKKPGAHTHLRILHELIDEEKPIPAQPNRPQPSVEEDITMSAVGSLLQISSVLELDADMENEEVKTSTNPRDVINPLRDKLLELLSNRLDPLLPIEALRLFVENQLKICEVFFAEGKAFSSLSNQEIFSLLYYVCFLICNLYQFKKQQITTMPLTMTLYSYLNTQSVPHQASRSSLLFTLSRMSEQVSQTVEANCWLRVQHEKLSTQVTTLTEKLDNIKILTRKAKADFDNIHASKAKVKAVKKKNTDLKNQNEELIVHGEKQEKFLMRFRMLFELLNQGAPMMPTLLNQAFINLLLEVDEILPATSPVLSAFPDLSLSSPTSSPMRTAMVLPSTSPLSIGSSSILFFSPVPASRSTVEQKSTLSQAGPVLSYSGYNT